MWAIDRTNLIILGVALGLIVAVGLVIVFAPDSPSASLAREEATPISESPSTQQDVAEVSTSQSDTPSSSSEPAPQEPDSPSPSTVDAEPAVDGIIQTGEYRHATEAGGFRVYWDNDATALRVGLVSPGTGYVAIGFDPDYRMEGANFIIGAVRNGQAILRDDYGTGAFTHRPDLEQGGSDNILAAAGRELNNQTTVEFVIPLDSGDPYDKRLQPGETYEILVAFHTTSDNFSARHSQRGSGEIRLDDTP